ncbi:MAG: anti-sigma factor family protein [Gemmatimonadota bacterium]
MDHLNEGTLQALIDDELSASDRQAAERHVAECSECAEALSEARVSTREASAALAVLDRPAPVDSAFEAVLGGETTSGWFRPGSLPRAAVLILGFAAAASAAVPGSPVRDWATTLIDRIGGEGVEPETTVRLDSPAAAPASSPARADDAGTAGIAVVPRGEAMRVLVATSGHAGWLRVRVVEADEVTVAADRSVAARFETGAGRVRASATGPGTITVELPRGLLRAEVVVDGSQYLRKEGERLHLSVAPSDATDTDLLFEIGASDP